MYDDNLEDDATKAVIDIRKCVQIEEGRVEADHELYVKLQAIDAIWTHLNQNMPPELGHVHTLNRIIYDAILDIRAYLEESELVDISILKENRETVKKLCGDIAHKDWQATKLDVNTKTTHILVEKEHLRVLHHKIKTLLKNMNEDTLMNALKADVTSKKDRHSYAQDENYFFVEIYKFIRTYEYIFRHLWKKEHRVFVHSKKK
jgi:hypothetical protein